MAKNWFTRGTGVFGRIAHHGGGEMFSGTALPDSGTSGLKAPVGSIYICTTNYVQYVNEGTESAPYWTPVSFSQPGLIGYFDDFRDQVDKAVTDTDGTHVRSTGVRLFGQGMADTDSGMTIASEAEFGALASLITTNENAHLIALGVGETAMPFQPDTHGPMVIDVEFTHNSAITLRATFCGFVGAAADAMDPVVTGATTTISFAATGGDDACGIFQDVGLTDGDGLFAPHVKDNAAASIATTATGVDLSTTIAAAGTFQRWRVEVLANGTFRTFVNKVQKSSIASALEVTEEVYPVFYIESTSAATKQVDVRRFMTWGTRNRIA